MKGWIITVIIIICLSAFTRLIFTTQHAVESDAQNYVRSLKYKFTAKIDSAVVTNDAKGVGFLYCTVTSGEYDPSIENVLATQLKEHKRLRFTFPATHDFKVFLGGVKNFCHPIV